MTHIIIYNEILVFLFIAKVLSHMNKWFAASNLALY
jgi:hypothetical protein